MFFSLYRNAIFVYGLIADDMLLDYMHIWLLVCQGMIHQIPNCGCVLATAISMQTHRASKSSSSSKQPNVPLFEWRENWGTVFFLVYNECAYAMVSRKQANIQAHTYIYAEKSARQKSFSWYLWMYLLAFAPKHTIHNYCAFVLLYIRLERMRAKKQQQRQQHRRKMRSVERELCMIEWQSANVSLPCKNAMAKWMRSRKNNRFSSTWMWDS